MRINTKGELGNWGSMIACMIGGPFIVLGWPRTASAQTIQFYPIRVAPLGSPAGTVGDPVTPTFNEALDCWELKVPGGVEVDIDVQGGGWGNFPGNPNLGAVQATVISAGYSNGIGADLNPKGWPSDPSQGAYQAEDACVAGGDGRPCVPPFDGNCTDNGFCAPNPDWIFRPYMDANHLAAVATPTLNYGWATAAQSAANTSDPDPDSFGTLGSLILDVPLDAAGIYVIAIDPDPNRSFLATTGESYYGRLQFTAACITVIGACCVDTDSDGYRDSCHDDGTSPECSAASGIFLADEAACTGAVGACSLDDDGDGIRDTCRIMDQTCCEAAGGLFLGANAPCNDVQGACCLENDANCMEIALTSCVEQLGSFQGPGTTCQGDGDGNGLDDGCGDVVPALSDWGLIVLTLLLLAGGKLLFRIDRRRVVRS